MMSPYSIILPEDHDALRDFFIVINHRLNNIWYEYTTYVEANNLKPQTILIFPILFSELDFYETLLMRIQKKLPKETIDEIRDEFFFPDW